MTLNFHSPPSRSSSAGSPAQGFWAAIAAIGGIGGGDPTNPFASAAGSDPADEKGRRRALIVDDELFIAMHLQSVLEDIGLEVCELAATGAEALDFTAEHQPELIFMDVNLRGGMDGVEAARRLTAEHDVRIIFITAYGDPATLQRIKQAAPDAPIIQKPPMAGALEAAIKRVFAN